MSSSRTQKLIWAGIIVGLFAGMALAATFAPGDAGKVSDGVAFGAPDGMNVTIYGETNVSMGDVFPNSSTHSSQFADRSVILNTSDGNVTIASDDSAWAAVHTSNLTGAWTNVTAIQAGPTWVEIYPENKQRVDVRGDTDQISIANMSLDDGNADFWIEGPNSGTGTLTLYELTANTQIVAVDSNDNLLDVGTSDANGNLSINVPLSAQSVYLQTVGTTNTPTYSNADPQGIVSNTPNELSVGVNDSDFPTDDVEVTISLDGSQIHSENITSNGTITTSNYGTLDLGNHNWTVNSTDAYGNFQSTTYEFSLPSNITLRNESNASQVIQNKNITATFYSDNGQIVIQRGDTNEDGNISLRGLPDTSFVITFDGEGWYDRRAYIDSIGSQQDIYLLNSTAYPLANGSAIPTTFVYEDRTGAFGQSNTTLEIERAVDKNNDGNFSWQVVAGDYWGAAGEFPFTGQYQERYRLRIENQQTGDSRLLGTHIPRSEGVKNIIVGDIIFDAENATGRFYNAGINNDTSNLQVYYQDPTNGTVDLDIIVYEQGNQSNELYNNSFAGPLGEETVLIPMTDSQMDNNWIVTFEGETNDGAMFGQVIVGGASFPINMDPAILAALSLTMITFGMALYGPRVAIAGAWTGVMMLAGLMFLGWLDWSIAALTIALIAAAGGTLYKESMPG